MKDQVSRWIKAGIKTDRVVAHRGIAIEEFIEATRAGGLLDAITGFSAHGNATVIPVMLDQTNLKN